MFFRMYRTQIKTFNAEDYQYYIDNFPSEEILGGVTDSEDIKRKAEELWIELYGENVKSKKPYHVFFDPENEIWMVHGSLPWNKEGVFHIC